MAEGPPTTQFFVGKRSQFLGSFFIGTNSAQLQLINVAGGRTDQPKSGCPVGYLREGDVSCGYAGSCAYSLVPPARRGRPWELLDESEATGLGSKGRVVSGSGRSPEERIGAGERIICLR